MWCWRRLLRVPWTARWSNQSVHPKGDQSWVFIGRNDVEAETPTLWPPDVKSWLTGKDPDAGKDWGQEEKGTTEDEMAGWHHWLNGHEFEQISGTLQSRGSQTVGHDWATELNWADEVRKPVGDDQGAFGSGDTGAESASEATLFLLFVSMALAQGLAGFAGQDST